MELLGRMKKRVCIGMREERIENEEKELGREEIERVVRGLKTGKAAGEDDCN